MTSTPKATDTDHGRHGPYAEDQMLARSVVRRLCPRAEHMTDAQLDADPIGAWVSCLFRKVRDEVGQRSEAAPLRRGQRIEIRDEWVRAIEQSEIDGPDLPPVGLPRSADGQPELLAEEWERQYLWAVERLRQTLTEVRRWDMLNPGSGPEHTSDAPYFRKLVDDALALTVPRVQKGPYPTYEEEREVIANYIAEHSVLLSGHVRKPWLALAEEIRMGAHWYADANVPRRESPQATSQTILNTLKGAGDGEVSNRVGQLLGTDRAAGLPDPAGEPVDRESCVRDERRLEGDARDQDEDAARGSLPEGHRDRRSGARVTYTPGGFEAHTSNRCGDREGPPGLTCNIVVDHEGDHVSWAGRGGARLGSWPRAKAADEACPACEGSGNATEYDFSLEDAPDADTSWIVSRHNASPKYLQDVIVGDVWRWTDDRAQAWPMARFDAERYAFCSYYPAHAEAADSVGEAPKGDE